MVDDRGFGFGVMDVGCKVFGVEAQGLECRVWGVGCGV
jgi:hypothetical protein